jgi:hypothetical protein
MVPIVSRSEPKRDQVNRPDESLVDVRKPGVGEVVAGHLLVIDGHGLPLTAIKRTSFIG